MRETVLPLACTRAWCAPVPAAQAGSTFRAGSRVLTVGDSAVSTRRLPGEPAWEEPIEDRCGARRGERWP